jgi:hypothetical protein
MSDVTDAFRAFARDLLPRGAWWRGQAAERFLDGLTAALAPTLELLESLPDIVWPWEADRPILEQWHSYLEKVRCVATPALLEDLRARVLNLLRADPTVFPDGLESTILAYLPLVEINDLLPLSILGYNLPGPPDVLTMPFALDPAWANVEIWYPSTLITREQVLCVVRPFIPGAAIARPVAPLALFHRPAPSTLAGDIALHWAAMRATTDLALERRVVIGNALLETVALLDIVDADRMLVSDLFPLLSPGTSLAGQYLRATFTRTWADTTSDLAKESFYV